MNRGKRTLLILKKKKTLDVGNFILFNYETMGTTSIYIIHMYDTDMDTQRTALGNINQI